MNNEGTGKVTSISMLESLIMGLEQQTTLQIEITEALSKKQEILGDAGILTPVEDQSEVTCEPDPGTVVSRLRSILSTLTGQNTRLQQHLEYLDALI